MYKMLDLQEGVNNCVYGLAQIGPGENVLILDDVSGFADPLVLQTLGFVCKQAGAEVVYATCREFEPRVEDPPKIIAHALRAADVVFHVSSHEATLHCKAARIAMLEYGLRVIPMVANSSELMSSEWARFPADLYIAIARKVFEQLKAGKTIRVVGENGTDITTGLNAAYSMGLPYNEYGVPTLPTRGATHFTMFPPGVYGIVPMDPANGTIVYDVMLGLEGMCETPVTVRIKDHYISSIEGGWEADWFRALVESKKKTIKRADYLAEIMWGLNPKASINRGLKIIHLRESELTRRAGTLHFGVGIPGSGFHWDGVLIKPFSVLIDGTPMIENGRLKALDDPEIIDLASKYGDPKRLLTETP